MDKIIIVGDLNRGGQWQKSIREQNNVLGIDGISMAIPATYDRHPFKIMVECKRDERKNKDN